MQESLIKFGDPKAISNQKQLTLNCGNTTGLREIKIPVFKRSDGCTPEKL